MDCRAMLWFLNCAEVGNWYTSWFAPAVGFTTSAQQAEQSRLAVTVAADDSDAVTFGDANRDVVEHHTGGKFEADTLGAEQVGH